MKRNPVDSFWASDHSVLCIHPVFHSIFGTTRLAIEHQNQEKLFIWGVKTTIYWSIKAHIYYHVHLLWMSNTDPCMLSFWKCVNVLTVKSMDSPVCLLYVKSELCNESTGCTSLINTMHRMKRLFALIIIQHDAYVKSIRAKSWISLWD